jgi:hypothetical protein
MKKMIFVLTALLLAAPALANVAFSCSDAGDGQLQIGFVATEDTNLPRGMGLEVSVDGNATIESVVSTDADYWVYPGSIVIDPCTGTMTDQGTPVASGLGTGSVILEMGSLHYPTGPADVNSPSLTETNVITLQLDGHDDSSTNVTIAGNSERGNVVNYAANEAEVSYTGCVVEFVVCWTGDAASTLEWESVGKPECWCQSVNPRQCHGDAEGAYLGRSQYWVAAGDLTILKDAWQLPYGDMIGQQTNGVDWICADFNRQYLGRSQYRVEAGDLTILKKNWQIPYGPDPNCQDVVGSQE